MVGSIGAYRTRCHVDASRGGANAPTHHAPRACLLSSNSVPVSEHDPLGAYAPIIGSTPSARQFNGFIIKAAQERSAPPKAVWCRTSVPFRAVPRRISRCQTSSNRLGLDLLRPEQLKGQRCQSKRLHPVALSCPQLHSRSQSLSVGSGGALLSLAIQGDPPTLGASDLWIPCSVCRIYALECRM